MQKKRLGNQSLTATRKSKKLIAYTLQDCFQLPVMQKKYLPDINIKILDLNVIINKIAENTDLNMSDYSFDNFLHETLPPIAGFNPDIIGISTLFCSNYHDLGAISLFLKKKFPEAFLICGGHLASAVYHRIFKDNLAIDAISFGEGEIPFFELLKAINENKRHEYLENSNAWITKQKIEMNPGFIPEHKLVTNLDDIPRYDFSTLLSPDAYYNSTNYFFVIDTKKEQREMFIFSTRGCPHHCVFCASQNVHGHKIRQYSTERIKSDIMYFAEHYNITRFVFYDDHFLSKKKRAIEILNFIAEKKLNAEIPTPAFFSIDDEVASAMKNAGIKEVNITIESGNQNTLKNIMHKPANLERANFAVDCLHKYGIIAISNILIGLPGETKEFIDKGLDYLLTTDINWFQCFVTAPLPGSELYEICEKNGYFTPDADIMAMDFKKCVIKTPDFTPAFIEKKAYEMNLKLNFVNNYDFRKGEYLAALRLFERIIEFVIDTHAFAYYYAAKCCQKLNFEEKYIIYKNKYEKMITQYPFWKEWAEHFNLGSLD